MNLTINVSDGHCGEPDSIRALLGAIMSSLQELNEKVTTQGAQLAAQGDVITALRAYVSGIEVSVRDLASGAVLSADVQAQVDAIVAKIDANAALVAANTAGVTAAGDGDLTT